MDDCNPFSKAQLLDDAYRSLNERYRVRALGVKGLQHEYATDKIEIEEFERLIGFAIEAEEDAEYMPRTDAPGAVYRMRRPQSLATADQVLREIYRGRITGITS